MEDSRGRGAGVRVALLTVAVSVGFLALILLFPASGVDTDPPQCFSTFGYTVPCGSGLSFATGVVVAGALGFAFLSRGRSRP